MILQINVYGCVRCGEICIESEEPAIWSDPLVSPPKGWELDENYEILCSKCSVEYKKKRGDILDGSKKMSDVETLNQMTKMCEESCSPNQYEEWLTIRKYLCKVRKLVLCSCPKPKGNTEYTGPHHNIDCPMFQLEYQSE